MSEQDVIATVIRMWEADTGIRWPGLHPPSEDNHPALYRHARAVLPERDAAMGNFRVLATDQFGFPVDAIVRVDAHRIVVRMTSPSSVMPNVALLWNEA